ncbi:hypothetical protein [Oceanobacillus arenosus]|uniref:hypothetical protein n=1 Tax=Oceanobacillus arenosus TaxID=1229153 RepID=UPI001B867E6A|nr:hypothetical protein [Oceanobacillus arenosus]
MLAVKNRKQAFQELLDSEALMIDLHQFAEVKGLSCFFFVEKIILMKSWFWK